LCLQAISKYEGVQAALHKLQSPCDVGWLRVNTTPIKQALLLWCSKWINTFTYDGHIMVLS
jgi:dynein heavy chain